MPASRANDTPNTAGETPYVPAGQRRANNARGRGRGRGRGAGMGNDGGRLALGTITNDTNNRERSVSPDIENPDANKSLEEQVEDLQRALLEAQQEAAEAAATAAAAAAAAAQAAANNNVNNIDPALQNQQVELVPKPTGSAGDGYCLIEKMGMINDKPAYNAILLTIHELCYGAGLEFRQTYKQQNKAKLVRIFEVARKRHPYLNRFENNWAADAICHQYFKNHRRRVIKAANESTRTAFAAAQAELDGADENYLGYTRHVATRAARKLAMLANEPIRICF